jgi:hypothetical protein
MLNRHPRHPAAPGVLGNRILRDPSALAAGHRPTRLRTARPVDTPSPPLSKHDLCRVVPGRRARDATWRASRRWPPRPRVAPAGRPHCLFPGHRALTNPRSTVTASPRFDARPATAPGIGPQAKNLARVGEQRRCVCRRRDYTGTDAGLGTRGRPPCGHRGTVRFLRLGPSATAGRRRFGASS